MRISDWSSDVCSSDIRPEAGDALQQSLVDRGDISTLCLIIAKRRPGNGMIALSQPEEAARGQDDIAALPGQLDEDELVASAQVVALAAMHSLPPTNLGSNPTPGFDVTGNGVI